MPTITWYDFAPAGSGSFGREDMGSFCKIGDQLFIVPLLETSARHTTTEEIETKIAALIDTNDSSVYELTNNEFINSSTTDWNAKINESTITESTRNSS